MLKAKAYKFILKVRKFQLPTVYSFSTATAEGETWLWVDSTPSPGLIGLNPNRTGGASSGFLIVASKLSTHS